MAGTITPPPLSPVAVTPMTHSTVPAHIAQLLQCDSFNATMYVLAFIDELAAQCQTSPAWYRAPFRSWNQRKLRSRLAHPSRRDMHLQANPPFSLAQRPLAGKLDHPP